jgi:hypothetical protein
MSGTFHPDESKVGVPRLKKSDRFDEHDVCFSFSQWLL